MAADDDIVKDNPDNLAGVEIDYEPQIDNSIPSQRLYPHVFPANKAAWNRWRGPLPQLGSVMQIVKRPSS